MLRYERIDLREGAGVTQRTGQIQKQARQTSQTGLAKRPRHWPRRLAIIVVSTLAATQIIGWATADPQIGQFRSAADQDAYVDAYHRALSEMPPPTRTLNLETSFGMVRAYEWEGPDTSTPPVLLLPGRGSGVPMWSENLPELQKYRTVYAFDAIGDAGLSTQSAPITSDADQAEWINDALNELEVERAHVVGHSFGSTLAVALALHFPERVATLSLLEPAFVLGWPPISTLFWSIPASLGFLPQGWRNAAVARVAGEDLRNMNPKDPVTQMITLGGTNYSVELPTPRPLSDTQLGQLTMPVYVALAETSPITNGAAAIPQAQKIPDVTARVWSGTSHSLPMQVTEPLTKELAMFWDSGDLSDREAPGNQSSGANP